MLIMSQCNTFHPFTVSVYPTFVKEKYMKYQCDLIETQDMVDFQGLTNLIRTYGPQEYKLPNVTGAGVPLSTVLTAHHNLVTYGVGFEWVRPKPPDSSTPHVKRFYTAETVVEQLVGGPLFSDDAEVQAWYSQKKGSLEPVAVAGMPGMARWVQLADKCFSTKTSRAECNATYAGWFEVWNETHPEGRDDPAIADL